MKLTYILTKLIKKLRGSAIADSQVNKHSKVESGSLILRSRIEKHSFCGYDCTIIDAEIGAFTSIGGKVTIGGAMHPMHFVSTSPVFLSHRDSIRTKFAKHVYLPRTTTRIGSDVWIGDGVYIKAGINIGHGAVIGMGSVVTKDVEAYSIVAGNPAKLIRKRFSDDICDQLLSSEWWQMSDDELHKFGSLFDNPIKFIEVTKVEKL